MTESELLKVAYFVGLETAFDELQLHETQKIAMMENIVLTAEQLAKSKAAREAAKRAVKKPGFFARLLGAGKDPAMQRARERALSGGLATESSAYGKFRGQKAPLRHAPTWGGR